MNILISIIALIALVAATSPAIAEEKSELAKQMDGCRAIADKNLRSKCVDQLILELAEKNQKGHVTPEIVRLCSRRWPDDFSMEAWCREQQAADKEAAISALVRFETDGGNVKIKDRVQKTCVKRWYDRRVDATDYSMLLFCFNDQLDAAKRMGYD